MLMAWANKTLLAGIVIIGWASGLTIAQESTAVGPGQQTSQSVRVTSSMDYLLFLPADYQPKSRQVKQSWPLLIFLHGAGERGTDLESVKKWGPPKRVADDKEFPFVVVSPQCPKGIYWNVDHVNQLIDQTVAVHNIDADRVYLTGLSMGGFGTWALAAKYPQKFAAIAPICGGGKLETAAQLIDVPVWAFHGKADKVVPVAGTLKMIEAIKKEGGTKTKSTIYPGVGHNSWSQTYANPALYEWLLSHRR